MIKKNTINITIIFFLISFFSLNVAAKINTSILMKINNEIVTNIDLENEKKFLLLLNPNMKSLSKSQIEKIAKSSLINRKIKEIELNKYFEIDTIEFGNAYFENFIRNSIFKNQDLLNTKLKEYNVELLDFKRNIVLDNLWKEFIFDKFKSKIKVDVNKLRQQLNNQKNQIEEINISEILFKIEGDVTLKELSNKIYAEIEKSGFEATAGMFSISDSKNYGGKIGWIKSNQISKEIFSQIDKNRQITDPIKTSQGYLILKINDRRDVNQKIDFDEELKKLINIETSKELNKLGFIYFNKIKKRIFISES